MLLSDVYLEERNASLNSHQRLLFQFLILAQHTSYATLNLASWGLVVPALALNRVRLEQTIVSSYLIHEDKDKGIEPFIKHMSVNLFLGAETAFSDSTVKLLLSNEIDLEKARQAAIESMIDLDPEFDSKMDKFQRKWTKLDLGSMAKRRDKITASMRPISSLSLETFYATIYKVLNSVVHSDILAISPCFIGSFDFSSAKPPSFISNQGWIEQIYASNALFDIIQNYETMSFLGIDCLDDFSKLIKDWRTASKIFEINH